MTMKKLAILLLLLTLLRPLSAYAAETAQVSGTCGEGLSWSLSDHTLTISGSGDMDEGCPWERYKDDIRTLVLTGGVSSIGAEAFYGCGKLKQIDFGDSLREIGEKAFYDCDRLTQVRLPETFRSFGAQCFRDCDSLTKVYCDGNMPRFNDSCLWNGNYIIVYHALDHPWPQEAVSVLLDNFGGRLDVIPANPDVLEEPEDSWEALLEETQPTQPPETVPPETVPPTTVPPTTVPTTTVPPTTVPPTTVPPTTVPPATVPATTLAPTTEETQPLPERDVGGDGWIGLVLIGGVLTFLLVGILIFRGVSRKGGRYE